MFIQTELTPNPKTVKFIPGKEVSPKRVLILLKQMMLQIHRWRKGFFS